MYKGWSYYNPVQVFFGVGVRRELSIFLNNKSCLVVTSERGQQQMQADALLKEFIGKNDIQWINCISSNPDVVELQALIDECGTTHFDAVIGFGGGSALDSAKVLAVGLSTQLRTYNLEDLLLEPDLIKAAETLPLYTLPTTSGTGSEVTPFATVWNHKQKKKYSLAGQTVFPKVALVDPELTINLPLESTINTGLDALNQAAESIWNKNSTPMTFSYAARALNLGLDALPKLVNGSRHLRDRSNMAECSLLAGLAISHTRTALCHSISYPLTAHFGVPHGLACAFTMSEVLRLNMLVEDSRFLELMKIISSSDLQKTIDQLIEDLKVKERVKNYIPSLDSLLNLATQMYTPGRADNNLHNVDIDIIKQVLKDAW